jgi:hypothetical protein
MREASLGEQRLIVGMHGDVDVTSLTPAVL